MPQLARRVGRARPSAIMQVAEKAKRLKAEGRDIISFSIGVPNFLPGPHVYAAAREALEHDSGQYGSNRGSDALLDAFIGHLDRIGLPGYTRAHCASGIGAKHILYTLAEVLLDEGDGFAFATPYWTTYLDIAEIVGADIQLLPCPPEQDYKLTPAQLDAALARKPKVFLFNNPSNPTGMVYTQGEIAALADVLVRHPDTWIVTDDIYNRMVFDGVGYHNVVQARPELRERTIFVDSLSKTYGMPGWRVGLLAGPENVAKAFATMNSNHITNVPEVVTAAAVAALTGPQDFLAARRDSFAARRDLVVDALNRIDGIQCRRPEGAFYAFASCAGILGRTTPGGKVLESDRDFCAWLLDEVDVAVVPGSAFGLSPYFRISYATSAAELTEAMTRIGDACGRLT